MTSVNTNGLDDFNPFSGDYRQNRPAVMNSGDIAGGNEGTSLISASKSVPNYKQQRKNSDKDTPHPNNWPPIPECCPIQPCFYHNISEDIPESMVQLVTGAYYIWIGYSLTMIFNVFGTLAYYLSTGSMEAGSTFGMSIILLILLPAMIYLTWFRPLYKATKSDSSVNYFIYFLISFGQVTVTTIQCIGINWLGACGWLNGTIVIVEYKTAGIIMLFIATLFTVLLVAQIVLLIKVHQRYRNIIQPLESTVKDKTESKHSETLRDIAMRSGSNYALDDIRDNK